MKRQVLNGFVNEMLKISSDLMTPAVVSDSAIVDGPPATPFTRKKGFRKLEKVGPVKEAAADPVHLARAGLKRLGAKAKRLGVIAKHLPKEPGPALGALYHEIPHPIRAVGEAVAGDPATIPAPTPIGRLFGLG